MNKIKKLIYIVLCLLLATNTVKADVTATEISPSGYSINVEVSFGTGTSKTFKATLSHPEAGNNNIQYFIYLVENQNSPKPNIDYSRLIPSMANLGGMKEVEKTSNIIKIYPDWYLHNDYEWAYVIKKIDDGSYNYTYEITNSPIKMQRPALPSITERYKIYLFEEYNNMSISTLFPTNGTIGEHKLITKIGKVNDNTILKKIRDGATDGYSSLLSYAKNNNGQTWNYDERNNYKIDLNDFNVVNGAYYYIYTTYTDSGNLYRNLDGISLVMGKYDMLVNEVVWSGFIDDTQTPDDDPEPIYDPEPIEEEPIETDDSTVELTLDKAYSNKLDLNIEVNYAHGENTGTCEIYLIPDPKTAFPSGTSYVIGTVDDCKNGNNKYTIGNLQPNSKYKFQVVLHDDYSTIPGEEYVTFSTTKSTNVTTTIKNQEPVKTNPQTGTIAITIAWLIGVGAIVASVLYFKQVKNNEI